MSEENQPTQVAKPTEHFTALKPGTRLGRYEIESVLGQGGFGITYRARDTELNRAVAIKEYLPSDVAVRIDATTVKPRSTADQDSYSWGLTRFLDEARSLAQFDEIRSVVRVYDYMQANGTAYMVMALVEGEPLSRVYAREGGLAQDRLQAIALAMLDGLEMVHQAGFLHRDIKPSNIVLRRDGSPVLLDFGAARSALSGNSKSITAVFTPGYAPFEQYMSQGKQGPWTDIYALAATLYQGVTGKPPPAATDRVYQDEMTPAIGAGAGRYDPGFLEAIDYGLAVQEKSRPQSVEEWRPYLQQGLGAGATAVPLTKPVAAAATPSQGRSQGGGPVSQPSRPSRPSLRPVAPPPPIAQGGAGRPRLLLIGGAVAAVLATGGVAAALLLGGKPTDTADIAMARETPEARAKRLADQAQRAAEEARRAQEVADIELKRKADEVAKREAEEAAKRKAEDEVRQRADAEARRRADEAQRATDGEAKRKAEEEARKLAEDEAMRRADADARAETERRAADEARKKMEAELAEARKQAEDARRAAEELRQKADADRKAADDAKLRSDQEAKKKAEDEAKKKAEDEAKRKLDADAAKKKAEEEAKKKADEAQKQQQQATVGGAPADVAVYLSRHTGTIKSAAERYMLGHADDFSSASGNVLSNLSIGSLSQRSQRGNTLILAATVNGQSGRYGNTMPMAPIEILITVTGFPDAMQFVKAERIAKPQAAPAPAPQQQAAAPASRFDGYWSFQITACKWSGGDGPVTPGDVFYNWSNLPITAYKVNWAWKNPNGANQGNINGTLADDGSGKLTGSLTTRSSRDFQVSITVNANGDGLLVGQASVSGGGRGGDGLCKFSATKTF